MKIGFTFFRAIFDLWCIFEGSRYFCVFLIGWKMFTHVAADWAVTGDVAPMWDIRGRHVAMMWMLAWQLHKTVRPD